MKTRLSRIFSATLLGFSILMAGCEKEKEDKAPALPPLSSFAIDLDNFKDAQEKSDNPKSNFHIAITAVAYWQTVLSLSLAVPVASYAEAFNHKAVRVDNDTWEWSYLVNKSYSARLTADVVSDSVFVTMYITREGQFENAIWYTGKFDILRTGGEWTVYDVPLHKETAWLGIEWNADYEAQTFDIRYQVIKPDTDYEGSYIEYGITEDEDYNAYYNLFNSATQMLYEIEYNTETHEGTITDGLNRLCWDENHENTQCV